MVKDARRYYISYSESGLLTEKIDPRGERYTRQYNDIGRVEQATDPAGGLWQTFNNKLGLNESLFGYTTAEGNTQQVEQRVLPNGDTLSTTTTLSGAERVRLTSEDKLTESITAYGMSQVIHKELDEKTLQPVPRHITVTTPSGLTRTTGITKTFAQNGADTSAYILASGGEWLKSQACTRFL